MANSSSFPSYATGTDDSHHSKEHRPIVGSIKESFQKFVPKEHELNNNVAKFLTGTIAFYTTSFLSQCMQYTLKISTGTRPTIIPRLIGATTVVVGSYMGHLGGIGVQSCWNRLHPGVDVREIARGGINTIIECIEPMKLMFEPDGRLNRGERKEKRDVWIHAAGV